MDYKKLKKSELIIRLMEKDAEVAKLMMFKDDVNYISLQIIETIDEVINEYYKKFIINKMDENKPIYKEVQNTFLVVKTCISKFLKNIGCQVKI